MAKLADALDLGSSALRHGGSSPFIRTSVESVRTSHTTPTFINGYIHKVAKTNLSYIEPHKIIIKGITFLAFNYSNEIYIKNLSQKIKLSELEDYLKGI